jgi:plasmid stabilization system protein ParE
MQAVFRPEAFAELLQAKRWYEERSPGLGFEFARAADAALARAIRAPLTFPQIDGDFRHVLMRKFPYSVIYHPTPTELVVVSVFHHRRQPGSWLRNMGN